MNPDNQVPPYRWFQRRSDSLSAAWAEQLTRAFELLDTQPTGYVSPEQAEANIRNLIIRSNPPATQSLAADYERFVKQFEWHSTGSGEPIIPSVPWEPTPLDQMFLKSVGIKPE